MDNQNFSQPPLSNSAGPAMSNPNQNSELYKQIAGEDTDLQVTKKQKKSPFMAIVVLFMRVTLYLDSLRRSHEQLFHVLSVFWVVFACLLYLSGILVLGFAVSNRMQLPLYLEDQMRARDIQFKSAEYGMDRILVRDLTDKDGNYTIDNLVIYSTFTDLLQKRIRLVSIDGLTINFDAGKEFNLVKDIPEILSHIQHPTRGRLDLIVNALTVNNAKLVLKNQQTSVPVTFSMESSYIGKTQIMMPIFINQPSLQAKGTLAFSDESSQPEWTLSITDGEITLPRSSPEKISGTLKLHLNQEQLDNLEADFKLGYGTGTIEKHINAIFRRAGEEDLSFHITWQKDNLTEPNLSSHLVLSADHFIPTHNGSFQITGPFVIESKKFNTQDFSLTNFHAPLNVLINCRNWTECTMDLKENASISIQDVWFDYQQHSFVSKESVQFTLLPQNRIFAFSDTDPYFSFNVNLKDMLFDGLIETTGQKLVTEAGQIHLVGALSKNSAQSSSHIELETQNLSYQTPDVEFHDASLSIDNLLIDAPVTKMQATAVRLPNIPLLSHPFTLDMNMNGTNTKAQVSLEKTPISLLLEGLFSPIKKTFAGRIYIKPFDLSQLTEPLSTLWREIPTDLTNLSGKMTVIGQLNWRTSYNVAGPINVGLKDVSFTKNGTRVTGLNTVVTLNSLAPFVTQQNQHLSIQTMDGLVPFQDFDIRFEMDGQSLRLDHFSATGAGIPLMLPATVISPKGASLLTLRNTDPIDAKLFQRVMPIPNVTITAGTANLSIPVEVQGSSFSFSNIIMKMTNVLAQRQGQVYSNIFANAPNYFIRTGQIIMDTHRVMQLVLNGRLLPSRTAKDVQLNDLVLPTDFFQPLAKKPIPSDIQNRLNTLFKE